MSILRCEKNNDMVTEMGKAPRQMSEREYQDEWRTNVDAGIQAGKLDGATGKAALKPENASGGSMAEENDG